MELHTPPSNCAKAWASNASPVTTVASYVDSVSTEPATDASICRYVLDGTPTNGILFQTWHSASAGTFGVRVIGYRKIVNTTHWQPFQIAQYTVTHDATAGTTAGQMGALYPAITHTKNYGDGRSHDSVAAQKCPGFAIVDTVGFEKVAIVVTAGASTPTGNMLVGTW